MSTLLAIDPGINGFGWAYFNGTSLMRYGDGHARRRQSPAERVEDAACQLVNMMYAKKPDTVVIEDWMGKAKGFPAPSMKVLKLEITYRAKELVPGIPIIYTNVAKIGFDLTGDQAASKEKKWEEAKAKGWVSIEMFNDLDIAEHTIDAVICGRHYLSKERVPVA